MRIIPVLQYSPQMLISLTILLATLSSIFVRVLPWSSRTWPCATKSGGHLLWLCLSRLWRDWRSALAIVKPETVVAWHRADFPRFWRWKVRRGQPRRPLISREVRDLIPKMGRENPSWGAPRIHGELLKLGIDIAASSVSKYLVRCHKPPSQTWRTFLENRAKQLVSIVSLANWYGVKAQRNVTLCFTEAKQQFANNTLAMASARTFSPLPVGHRVAATGAYVIDRQHGWTELHPVTSIVPVQ